MSSNSVRVRWASATSKTDLRLLTESFDDICVPTLLHTDIANEFTEGCLHDILSQSGGIKSQLSNHFNPWKY